MLVWLLILLVIFIGSVEPAKAVMPPDFVFNIGTQIIQAFSVIVLFLSAIIGIFYQFIKTWFYSIKSKRVFWIISIILILLISLGLAYYYGLFKQKVELEKWSNQSKKYQLPFLKQEEKKLDEEIDQLKIGSDKVKIDKSNEKFVANFETKKEDASTKFIEEYYAAIANQDFEKAYNLSKKTVDLNTFKSWYEETTKITLDKLTAIDGRRLSLELTLYESENYTRYGVLTVLNLEDGQPKNIEKSEVRVLNEGTISKGEDQGKIEKEYGFYTKNQSSKLVITNEEFKKITETDQKSYFVLDAREDLEFDNGSFPGSTHIRFADLRAGRWIEVPNDKFVYVLCWSGIRGKEVAEFLRTKKIAASYLENGANGWVDFGGKWNGEIKFLTKYAEPEFTLIFTTDQVREKVREGVKLVDCREPAKYNASHVLGSVNIPIMYTPSVKIKDAFIQVSPNSKVITICDDYVNCFDAKITGAELEKRGQEFLGRYNKPWEY